MSWKYFLIILLFLAACEQAVPTVHTSELAPIPSAENKTLATDLCSNVTCGALEQCKLGTCECTAKTCNGSCIETNKCCTAKDCPGGTCDNGTCKHVTCSYNEVLKDGTCTCQDGYTYCNQQHKCVKKTGCCVHTQCDKFSRCTPTGYRSSVCIEIGPKKLCRQMADTNRTETIDFGDLHYQLLATNWNSDGSLVLTLNNETITLKPGAKETLQNLTTIAQEGITVSGGYCKEDDRE